MSKTEVTTLTAADIQKMLDVSPFNLFLGLTVIDADPVKQEVTMRSAMRPEFERRPGSKQWHGGVIASVIDTVGDFAVGMMVGRGLPTVNFRVDYLKPAVDTALVAVSRVRRAGKSVGVADVDVFDEKGSLLAIGRGTYSTLDAK
ncbi:MULTISPECIES: PaaI family thioesterase [Bradyrhizobium]|uniref:PaaI family thioesterase n=1 Tax=Bradyrhizobium TaxID=374 RepID=UPI0004281774|nr:MULTISPECIES: PaaI family thioesterase [Bradyrhizobium]MBO4220996.1 hotdog fold thioesterase [Bradyrhizobium neotropicale]RZN36257.1 PaaI family thioesterase [Bradyrhizobium sp. Leo121]